VKWFLNRWWSPPPTEKQRKTSAVKAVIRSTLVHAGYSEDEAYRLADLPSFTQLDADLLAMVAAERAK